MSDQTAAPAEALEQVIAAARAHLAAVQAAEGDIDDEQVWQTYVALNNASYEYDQLLLDTYGEVTPWDVERIDPGQAQESSAADATGASAADPYPAVLSVRQRRDYRVPSVAALLSVATEAMSAGPDDDIGAPETVAEAVLGLVQAGNGSLASLDIPVLEPLDGVVTVAEVAQPLDLVASGEAEDAQLHAFGPDDRVVGRLEEHPYLDDGADIDDALVAGDPVADLGADGR